ncbi:MAG: RICIN domain-containing protein, partial [Lachnospiraceae bacterium]|nr:RICIN domain-containing protein [Lachnospiraceae bacterium]
VMNVYVDGVLAGTVDIQSTGSFATFQTFEGPVVNLTAGNHTLKLEAAGAAGYAINWIELAGMGTTPEPETQAPETQAPETQAPQTQPETANDNFIEFGEEEDETTQAATNPAISFGNDDRTYAIKASANNLLACAENYGNDPVVARTQGNAQEWEQFKIVWNNDGTVSLLSMANNKYLSETTAKTLIAQASSIGNTEKFDIRPLGDSTYSIKSVSSGKYVTCDLNNNAVLVADRDSVGGAWEVFTIAPSGEITGATS